MTIYTFGELLKTYRINRSLTQRQLAERCGQGRNTISNWERGQNLPRDREDVLRVAEALNLETSVTNDLLKAAGYATISLEEELTNDLDLPINPLPYTQATLDTYLTFLQNEYGRLRLPNEDSVPLERIYVSLKADAMNAAEREAEREFLMADIESLHGLGAAHLSEVDEYRRHTTIWQAIKKNPRMQMLHGRNQEMIFGDRKSVV